MDTRLLAADVVELVVARASHAELDAARRGVRRTRVRRLRAFARARVRAALSAGARPDEAARRARAELRARALERDWFDEACLAVVDVVDRHLVRAQGVDGSWGFDRRWLRDALALSALRAIEAETGLRHATSDLPAMAVRALLDACALDAPGGELAGLLDRLDDARGRRAVAHCAAELAAAAPGLDPGLLDALAARAVRSLGFDVDDAAVRRVVRRERERLHWERSAPGERDRHA